MGYTAVSTYSTFNTSPTTINLLRIGCEYLIRVRFERRKVDKNANLHENLNMQTPFWSLWNIFAKFRENRSL